MSRHARNIQLLEKINNIDEDSSGDDEQISDIEGDQEKFILFDQESDTDSNEEGTLVARRGQKRKGCAIRSKNQGTDLTETAADGTIWQQMKDVPIRGKTQTHNIFREMSGPTAYAKRNIMKGSVRSAFSLIIDEHMIERIRKCTEAEALRVLDTEWRLPTAKLYAFIGLLYARGAYENRNVSVSLLWNQKWGPAFFSNTMSRNNFTDIMRYIRFDNRSQRSQRLLNDKFALVSEVWYKFIENSQNCYKPGPYISVDEQLFPTKARCRFTQYMPNKPDKFGIKFWLACDVSSKYVANGFPYLGKDAKRESSIPLGEFVTLKLMEPYTGRGRNVTTDHFFTSLSLATKLLAKKTTILGTLRSNRRDLPKLARQAKDDMPRFSTTLYCSDKCTLTIYKAKPHKKVLILSSMHSTVEIEKTGTRLPETITSYNKTKFGVDVADQMARKYSVKSKSQRWPLQVFFNILDLAGINAWISYKESTGEKMSRQDFLFELGEELANDYHTEQQLRIETAARSTTTTHTNTTDRKSCQIRYCKTNKTNKICMKCIKYVCGKCAIQNSIICKKCG